MRHEQITFELHNDARGSLVAFESNDKIPFDIKRVFCIYDVAENTKRACHAHNNIEEVIVCLKGSCTCLLNDGRNNREIVLSDPKEGLYIPKRTWVEIINFTSDCILMVLCDSYYDESDYIRDFEGFISIVGE